MINYYIKEGNSLSFLAETSVVLVITFFVITRFFTEVISGVAAEGSYESSACGTLSVLVGLGVANLLEFRYYKCVTGNYYSFNGFDSGEISTFFTILLADFFLELSSFTTLLLLLLLLLISLALVAEVTGFFLVDGGSVFSCDGTVLVCALLLYNMSILLFNH